MKILYYYSKLNIGGAEKSTVRLLNAFAKNGHEVTLLLRWSGGSLECDLDKDVKTVHLKKNSNNKVKKLLENFKYYFRLRKLKKEKFDIVISGLFGYNPKILFKHLKAKQYYQLLRNDVEKTGEYGKTKEYMQKYGDKFSAYIGVSEYTTNSFKRCYSQFKDRAYTIYNILPSVPNKGNLEKPLEFDNDKFKILTVCRLSDKAKGLFRMVNVCKKLVNEVSSDFLWYVVGDGADKQKLLDAIDKENISKNMLVLGERGNPFPYYAYSDLVAVLSYYEGLCGVVNEAKMMGRPVIATKFSGIDEQIVNGENGIICDNDEESIFNAMKDILLCKSKIESMKINGLKKELLDNDKKIEKYQEIFKNLERKQIND